MRTHFQSTFWHFDYQAMLISKCNSFRNSSDQYDHGDKNPALDALITTLHYTTLIYNTAAQTNGRNVFFYSKQKKEVNIHPSYSTVQHDKVKDESGVCCGMIRAVY